MTPLYPQLHELLDDLEKKWSKMTCDTCGSRVVVHSSSEGTSYYEPVPNPVKLTKLIAALCVAAEAIDYCSRDDNWAVDDLGKQDTGSANEWKKKKSKEATALIQNILEIK